MLSIMVFSANSAVAVILLPSLSKAIVKAVSVTYPSICTPKSTFTVEPSGIIDLSLGGEV